MANVSEVDYFVPDRSAADAHFREVADTIREAARIAIGRNLTPAMLRELCAYGWEQVFL